MNTMRTKDGRVLEVKEGIVLDETGRPIPEAQPELTRLKKQGARWLTVIALILLMIPVIMFAGLAVAVFVAIFIALSFFGNNSGPAGSFKIRK